MVKIVEKIKTGTSQIVIKIQSLSAQQQIAYGCIVLGLILILLALILW